MQLYYIVGKARLRKRGFSSVDGVVIRFTGISKQTDHRLGCSQPSNSHKTLVKLNCLTEDMKTQRWQFNGRCNGPSNHPKGGIASV